MPKKKTLLAGLAAFASSPKGRKLMNDARARYDTPANRKKAMDTFAKLRQNRSSKPV